MTTSSTSEPLPTELLALLEAASIHSSNTISDLDAVNTLSYLARTESLPRLNGLVLCVWNEASSIIEDQKYSILWRLYGSRLAQDESRAPELAKELARISNFATRSVRPTTLNDLLRCLVKPISIPSIFANDVEKVNDQKLKRQMLDFRQSLHDRSRLLASVMKCHVDSGETAKDGITYDLTINCASILGDDRERWASSDTQSEAQTLLASLVSILPRPINSIQQLVTKHLLRILNEEIRPHFQHPRAAYAQHRERKESTKELNFQDQAWKMDRLDCVEILTWSLLQVKHPNFGPIQHLIFPPLLTLLDDWEPEYKQRGVQILRHVVVENSAPADVRRTGLGELFFECLSRTLTYQSHPPLVRLTLETIIPLISVIEIKETEAWYGKLEQLLEDGILRALVLAVGGKVEVLRIYLKGVGEVMGLLGVVGVKYLKPTLGSACEVLEMHQGDVETQVVAAEMVHSIIKVCWPR
ncbi:hypothetical protein HK097_005496 [Rhizophlyctis rosea]|uniref:Uncharacterized protein n=1 Tax=Rhizophlyctis rosea TaxID=64517 RepID=A0AAD5SEB3_9FUNG|nr:hypothetical protein HK097_005496 [Rhizophlyctis rosea]